MEQKEYFFEKLTPNDEVDISVYDEAMEFVFDNSDITNIAISGAYGAGKSSVIDSYKKKHTDKKFMHISLDTIILSDEETIQGVNIDNCLANYISSQGDYLNVQKPDIEKLISGFIFLDIKFKTIAYNKANMELFTRVYENDLYELTFENIIWVIVSEYGENNLYNIEHRNYTIIQTEPKSPLALYVATDMNTYVNEILKNCGGVIEDSEKYAIELINNSSVSDEGRVYDKNSYTTHIFAELKKNGWIYDYREKEDDSEKYIVIKYLTRTRR